MKDSVEISSINKDTLDEICTIISYPNGCINRCRSIIYALRKIGIKKLVFTGRVKIGKYSVLGKGCESIVLLGVNEDGRKVAIKLRREDSRRPSLKTEAERLKLVNKLGIGPKLLYATDDFLIMEYIKGESLEKAVLEKEDRVILRTIIDLLEQCWKMDRLGIIHLELSRPHEHVLIRETDGQPVIIDFETTSISTRKTNLTQVASFLFFRNSTLSRKVKNLFGIDSKKAVKLRRLLRLYKKNRGDPLLYRKIVDLILTGLK